MSGDYTRFTFKPLKDYSGLFKQQGRVDLDSDFNELIEIIDRRWRSETIDIFGHCVVCDVAGTPSEAFQIFPTGLGTFDIGLGRMYVDGIQVENHGGTPLRYLPDLGEQEGTVRTPYSDQPYFPTPLPPVLPGTPNTTDLVYIDAWQREVTVLEDPSIREIALGGPDTTTRIQSAWQVKALTNVGQHSCEDDIAAWNALIAPSAGRLTTSAVAPATSDDPCIISPSGGYRGLENRLYRVEIHSPGTIGGGGPAKFKWSRNNASIASTVSAITAPDKITVQQVGRDEVLRFEIGNFIEITDDFREFQSQAGHMARITNIDPANRIITFTPAIPVAVLPIRPFDATDATRHTRVRRWDQTLNVDANGLLDVVAGAIPIEDGVEVEFSFDPAGGNFKVGDYWVFYARTADGTVEPLTNAPPRGILHHFCRLGFIHWGANLAATTFDDCRNHWPPACECDAACTVTVGDGIDSHGRFTDIQQAINALGNRGGVVCIGRGFYRVTAPLLVDATKRNVRIVGTGPATRIVFDPPAGAGREFLRIQNTEHVSLERVFVASVNAESLIEISNSSFCKVEDCILVNIPFERQDLTGSAIEFVEDCRSCEIQRNALLAARAVTGLQSRNAKLLIRDNEMVALQFSVLLREGSGIEIVHNQMRGLPDLRIPGEALTRASIDEFQHAIANAFLAVPVGGTFQAAGVVIFVGAGVVISQNLIIAQVAIVGFLFLNARILQNDIASLVGILLLLGAVVKIEDNFILALFAGLINAGVVADLDCTSNEFLGINGILWLSFAQFLAAFGAQFASALTTAGLADGAATFDTLSALGTSTTTRLGFGAVIVAKLHRNLFLTFATGIRKTSAVLSADLSIVDNTFTFCQVFGIRLDTGGRSIELLRRFSTVINQRHLIQSNSFAIGGRAIATSTPMTLIEENSIQCPSIGIDLDAEFCVVRNNTITGTDSEVAETDRGLITLHSGVSNGIISGNILQNAAGHAILVFENIFKVAIQDNVISGARRFGIGGFNEIISLSASSIERNRIEACEGQVPANSVQLGAAVSIGAGANLRFIGNTVTNNAPTPGGVPAGRGWVAIYFEDIDGIEISENLVADNGNVAGLQGPAGAVRLGRVRETIRVQQNVIKNNAGFAFLNQTLRFDAHSIVQDNLFTSGPTPGLVLVQIRNTGSLIFQGNRCVDSNSEFGSVASVQVLGLLSNVSNNVVTSERLIGMQVTGESVVNANIVKAGRQGLDVFGASVIVTSNSTTGLTTPVGATRAHNLPPP